MSSRRPTAPRSRPSKVSERPVATRCDRQSTPPLPPAVRSLAWLLARLAAGQSGRGGRDV